MNHLLVFQYNTNISTIYCQYRHPVNVWVFVFVMVAILCLASKTKCGMLVPYCGEEGSFAACCRLALAKVKPKVLPLPSWLLKIVAPPWAIITFLAINSPSPVPSGRARLALCARKNLLNRCG